VQQRLKSAQVGRNERIVVQGVSGTSGRWSKHGLGQ